MSLLLLLACRPFVRGREDKPAGPASAVHVTQRPYRSTAISKSYQWSHELRYNEILLYR